MPKENTGLIWQEVLPEKPLHYQIWYKLCLNFGLNTRNTSTFQVKPGIFQLTSARLIIFAPIYNYIEFSFRKIKSRETPRNFLTNCQWKSEFLKYPLHVRPRSFDSMFPVVFTPWGWRGEGIYKYKWPKFINIKQGPQRIEIILNV